VPASAMAHRGYSESGSSTQTPASPVSIFTALSLSLLRSAYLYYIQSISAIFNLADADSCFADSRFADIYLSLQKSPIFLGKTHYFSAKEAYVHIRKKKLILGRRPLLLPVSFFAKEPYIPRGRALT